MATRSVDILLRGKDGVSSVFRRVDAAAGRLGKTLTILGAGSIAGAAAGFVALTKNSFEALDALGKVADRLGVTVEEMRALQYVGELAGSSVEGISKSVTFLNKAVGEAIAGLGQGKLALDELGISAEDLARMPLTEQIALLSDRFGMLETQEQKVFAATKLFGRSGVEMVNILDMGSNAIRQQFAEFERLGGTVDRNAILKVEAANDSISRLTTAVRLLADQSAVALAPAITQVSTALTDFVSDINIAQKSGISYFRLLGDEAARVLPFITSIFGVEDTGEFERLREELGKPISQAAIEENRTLAEQARERIRLAEEERLAKAKLIAQEAEAAQRREMEAAAARAEQERIDGLKALADRVRESVRTDQERLETELEQLRALLSEGLIDEETFARAVEKAREKLRPLIDETAMELKVQVEKPELSAVQERLLVDGGQRGVDPVQRAIDKATQEIRRLVQVGLEQVTYARETARGVENIAAGAI